jgi:hypothetical protein
MSTIQWRSQNLVLGGANLHFCLKFALNFKLMHKKFENSILSSA